MNRISSSVNKYRAIFFQYIRFNIVAVIYTIITYIIFSALIYLGVRYPIALLADYSTGVTLSFFLNKLFTFRYKERTNMKIFARMLLVYLIHFAVSLLLLALIVKIFSERKIVLYLGRLGLTILLSAVSFVFQKYFVFKNDISSSEKSK